MQKHTGGSCLTQSTVEFSKTNAIDIIKEAPVRVLLVDDESGFLKTTKPILEMQGAFQVETATSVEEAAEKMKKEEYDVVVSDYQMPGKDGLQFLKELRKKGNSIPFIVFTGKGREEIAIKALNLGAAGYFNKYGEPEIVYGEWHTPNCGKEKSQ
jgi:DNA-binding NtrC family response regulator